MNKPSANTISVATEEVKYVSVRTAAERYGVSRDFIMSRLSELGAIRCGRVYRIPLTGCERFEYTNRVRNLTLVEGKPSTSVVDRAIRSVRKEVR